MAEKQPHRIHPKDRVRIKDSVTHMYPNARAYNEAVVQRAMHDPLGYPLIYVHWDRDHWAYSGENDGWVMEAHFDKVEEPKMDDKPDFMKELADLIARHQSPEKTEENPEEEVSATEPGVDYESILTKALEDAKDGEAYVVLVAYPEEYRGTQVIVPRIYMHSKRDDAALLLDATMADFVAQSYSRLVTDLIQIKRDDKSGA